MSKNHRRGIDPTPTEGLGMRVYYTSQMYNSLVSATAEIMKNNELTKPKQSWALVEDLCLDEQPYEIDMYYVHLTKFDINHGEYDKLCETLKRYTSQLNRFRLSVSKVVGLHNNTTIAAELDQQEFLGQLTESTHQQLERMSEVTNVMKREENPFHVTLYKSDEQIPRSTWENVCIGGTSFMESMTLLDYNEYPVPEDKLSPEERSGKTRPLTSAECQTARKAVKERHSEPQVLRSYQVCFFEEDYDVPGLHRSRGLKRRTTKKSPYYHEIIEWL